MEDWKEYKLKDVAYLTSGFPFDGHKYGKDGVRVVRGDNVTIGSLRWDSEKDKRWSEPFERASEYSLMADDIVIGMDGSRVGKNRAQVKASDLPLLLAQRVACVRHNELSIQSFLYYQIFNDKFEKYIKAVQTGTSIPHVSLKQIGDYPIMLPPLAVQYKFSDILKSLDDKIECNRRINENLEQQAQALFKSWLNNCQDEVSIGDLALNITDYTKCNHDQVVLVNSSDVTEGHFDHHILSPNNNLKGHFKKRFQKGDILYSQVRPRNRHWGYCTFNADNYLASTQLMVIRNKEDIIPSILLYQYIIDDKVWMDFTLKTETRSGTFPQGNYEDLSSIKVPFCADNNRISQSLDRLYSIIYNNELESRRLAELRDTLLPKLMSGELKVENVTF